MKALVCTDAIRAALKPVGLPPEEVIDVLGSCLEGDEVYLVGSLAAGLGNAGSDVDLHVFVTEHAPGVVPMLFFADRTRLDLVHFEVGAPAVALAKVPDRDVALLGGRCALGPLPGMADLKRLSRWATAVAMYEGALPLFDAEEVARIAAALVRLALDVAVRAAALASIMQAAGSPLAPLAWSRAAEVAVEVVVRAEGEIFVGDKWLPTKARRLGLADTLLATARQVGSAAGYDRYAAELGLPTADPAALVRLDRADGPEFTFGERAFRLVGGRLLPRLKMPPGSLADVLGALGARELGAAISNNAISLTVDPAALDRRLT